MLAIVLHISLVHISICSLQDTLSVHLALFELTLVAVPRTVLVHASAMLQITSELTLIHDTIDKGALSLT